MTAGPPIACRRGDRIAEAEPAAEARLHEAKLQALVAALARAAARAAWAEAVGAEPRPAGGTPVP